MVRAPGGCPPTELLNLVYFSSFEIFIDCNLYCIYEYLSLTTRMTNVELFCSSLFCVFRVSLFSLLLYCNTYRHCHVCLPIDYTVCLLTTLYLILYVWLTLTNTMSPLKLHLFVFAVLILCSITQLSQTYCCS